ncbi:hypothetical protein H6G96_29485 [Nostoc sp. FACHB-892]|uniref:GumC family protein n=1 Tax=Nostoc sp. FACHB-892 TaxID=2692843 RepID=UPI0016846B17|nr:hypothetical protein [Nostoc sp. FACHB-892]MBD2730338.1 hypothetical protein [Nostoc sp. FACHB-892]
MPELTESSNYSAKSISATKGGKLYLGLWILSNLFIWSTALFYLAVRPTTYASEWSINLPALLPGTNVILPNIAQASSAIDSPYRSFADPRENYKFLALSDEVIKAAANQVKLPINKFGKPTIKILDNTTLMKFEIKGNTPQETQAKAFAFHRALTAQLEQLRKQETAQQDSNLEAALRADKRKLQIAKQRLNEYKARSLLNSSEQLRDISVNIENLRQQRAQTLAQHKEITATLKQLSVNLGLSPQEAADVLVLQSDPLFQQYLSNYSQASADLVNLSAKFTPDNPIIITKTQARDAAQTSLFQYARDLIGRAVSVSTLKQLITNGGVLSNTSSQRASLFEKLISFNTQEQGIKAQAQELGQQITQLESRLKILSQQETRLGNLERDANIAEAIFSSNVTKLSLNKPNFSVSYPQISIVTNPSLPTEPSGPKKLFVLAGTTISSLFLTTGIASLWLRERKLRQAKETTWRASANSRSPSIESLNSFSPKK